MLDRSRMLRPLSAGVVAGVRATPRWLWDQGAPGAAEDWAYHARCEAASPMPARALLVRDARGEVAAAPLFEFVYPPETPLHGRLAGPGRVVRRCAGSLVEWRALAIGSPLTEEGRLVFREGLTAPEKDAAFDAMVGALESEARRSGATAVGFKDLAPRDVERFGPRLTARGFSALRSLPVAVLDLGATTSVDGYLSTFPAETRDALRRRLRSRDGLTVEHRASVEGCAAEVRALYEQTRRESEVRYGGFEELPPGYFEAVGRLGPDRTHVVLTRSGGELVGFNLLLLGEDRVIDKVSGFRQPFARDHDLRTVGWMETVAFTLASGRRLLQTGRTGYEEKVGFGSRLEPRTIFAKHRLPPLNAALRIAAGRLGFDRWDPDLRRLAAKDLRVA